MDIKSLSLEEKVGQMLCLGWEGNDSLLQVNEQAKRCVSELHAGGMILFSRNVQARGKPLPPIELERTRTMLDDLQGLARVPLFVAVDQEGGSVNRFGAPFTPFPAPAVVGSVGDSASAREAARVMGTELRAVGVNFNCAPVADINSNPANPVIGDRSFSDSPEIAAQMVLAQVHGFRDGGVLACSKHFPGHGDTSVDSHVALPTLTHSVDTIFHREIVPFAAAIQGCVPAIMTAHILFPALDASGLPATLSRTILTDILRGQLGFEGLIVTDCLQMKAIANHWGTAKAAVMAVNAGADFVLVCHTWERQKETFDTLLAAVRSGELSEERVDDAVSRILKAKRDLIENRVPPLTVIGSEAHLAVARAIYEKAGVPFVAPARVATLGESAPALA